MLYADPIVTPTDARGAAYGMIGPYSYPTRHPTREAPHDASGSEALHRSGPQSRTDGGLRNATHPARAGVRLPESQDARHAIRYRLLRFRLARGLQDQQADVQVLDDVPVRLSHPAQPDGCADRNRARPGRRVHLDGGRYVRSGLTDRGDQCHCDEQAGRGPGGQRVA
jgi:hypothetical protein